jgi:hypothetical protein
VERRAEAMISARPEARIGYMEREIGRYREDVEGRPSPHEPPSSDCWPWEDVIDKANHLFDRLVELDTSLSESAFSRKPPGSAEYIDLDSKIREVIREWLSISENVVSLIPRLRSPARDSDGSDVFLGNVERARGMLTPDDEFFVGDKLVELRDAAIEAARRGEVEPMFDDVSP